MITVPSDVKSKFDAVLSNKTIPDKYHNYYRKWLRYYLDFCQKYRHPDSKKESLSHFLKKLQEKHQTQEQRRQAAHAVSIYYETLMHHRDIKGNKNPPLPPFTKGGVEGSDEIVRSESNEDIVSERLVQGTSPTSLEKIVQPESNKEILLVKEEGLKTTHASWKSAYDDLYAE